MKRFNKVMIIIAVLALLFGLFLAFVETAPNHVTTGWAKEIFLALRLAILKH